LSAPCTGEIVCFAEVNYSTAPDCEPTITAEDILQYTCSGETYSLELYIIALGDTTIVSNPVSNIFFDQEITVKITSSSGNSCISTLIITSGNAPAELSGCGSNISCASMVKLSADPNCVAIPFPELFLTNVDLGETYEVFIFEDPGFTISVSSTIPYELFGQPLYAKIFNTAGNFCTSILTVADLTPPFAGFFDDPGTLSCQDNLFEMDLAGALDACDDDVEVTLVDIEFLCGAGSVDSAILTYEAVDDFGNTRISNYKIAYVDFCVFATLPPDITVDCPEDIPDPEIVVQDIDCPRIININVEDIQIIGECDVSRQFIFTDDDTDLTYIYTQLITVDTVPPNFTANSDTEITYDELINNTYVPYAEVFDNCGVKEINIFVEYLEPEDCTRPEFMVRYFMNGLDNCGNEITETLDVLVIRDGRARVQISGARDCSEPFRVTAEPRGLVPPVDYTWASSDPNWTFINPSGNSIEVVPARGRTSISVTATDALGCVVTDSKNYNCNGRGVRGRSIESTNIGPNPFDNILTINNIPGKSTLTVYDLSGKILRQRFYKDAVKSDDINLFVEPAGLYIIHFKSEEDSFLRRVVKN
jgi:hypothetical protein